ncbi:molybdenum cofactor guanylyltransferase [Streptacidiphilus cavernicola]|uniref:Molybdenum cofactor guanylyltransferase n=1 Tax=Streptacidiphilus cavernicola TaxID=3342716 RepID=A0ABV6VV63_9ACTN
MDDDEAYDAVVLAGGAARRLGGDTDKPALEVGGRSLLDRVLDGCAGARTVVVVGPERATAGRAAGLPRVSRVREEPPGGGPVAAVAAGLPRVTAGVVLLLAADLPFFTTDTAEALVAELRRDRDVDAAVLVDEDGREQPLAAAYRSAPLGAALAALLAEHGGDPAGLPLRRLVGALRTTRVPDTSGAALDCDTWPDVERARAEAAARAVDRPCPRPDRDG